MFIVPKKIPLKGSFEDFEEMNEKNSNNTFPFANTIYMDAVKVNLLEKIIKGIYIQLPLGVH